MKIDTKKFTPAMWFIFGTLLISALFSGIYGTYLYGYNKALEDNPPQIVERTLTDAEVQETIDLLKEQRNNAWSEVFSLRERTYGYVNKIDGLEMQIRSLKSTNEYLMRKCCPDGNYSKCFGTEADR
jgi:hypothetical protein